MKRAHIELRSAGELAVAADALEAGRARAKVRAAVFASARGHDRFPGMVDSPGYRALAAVLAIAAGSVVSVTSVAHGLAHASSHHEHDFGHEHGPPAGPGFDHGQEAIDNEPVDDHAHPRIELAPVAKLAAWAVIVTHHVLQAPAAVPERASVIVTHDRLPGPAPPGTPPPRLRAPPIR